MSKFVKIPENITQAIIDAQLKGQPRELMTYLLKTYEHTEVDQNDLTLELNTHQTDGKVFAKGCKGPISRNFESYRSCSLERGGLVALGFLEIIKNTKVDPKIEKLEARIAELEARLAEYEEVETSEAA